MSEWVWTGVNVGGLGQQSSTLGALRRRTLVQQHFTENTPDSPHVNAFCVTRRTQQNLGRAVPARRNVVREDGCGRRCLGLDDGPAQAEITELDMAIRIEEHCGWKWCCEGCERGGAPAAARSRLLAHYSTASHLGE